MNCVECLANDDDYGVASYLSSIHVALYDMTFCAVLATIPPLFSIAENHLMSDPDEFKAALTPIVEVLFKINDRGVRGALLQRSALYSAHMDKAALNVSVFEPMCSGFTDSSGALRELLSLIHI